MTDLLALDPSVRSPGMAIFRDAVLIFAGRLSLKKTAQNIGDGERWDCVAEAIVSWANDHDCIHPDTIVYERPQIYTAAKSKGDPNDLIGLAAVGAATVARFRGHRFTKPAVLTPTPAEWCGQLPKATRGSAKVSPRAQRILSRLSPLELQRVPDQHDALDAIGLGLHALGRLGVRRVLSST